MVTFRTIQIVPGLKALIDKGKEVVALFTDILRAENKLKLVQSIDTRWKSSYEILEIFLQLRPILNGIIHLHTSEPTIFLAAKNSDVKEIMLL